MTIFEETLRPDQNLFFKRDDPNDIRLGETIPTAGSDYDAAQIVLLGLPQDEGVRRNRGRTGAAAAPDAIRRCLYKLVSIEGLRLFDLGNTRTDGTLEDIHARHRAIVHQLLHAGKTVIVLGGGNDTSFPDCAALADRNSAPLLAFNIDAHFDVRADTIPNSGTPYRQLLEGGFLHPDSFYEIGFQPFANSSAYKHYLVEKGVTAYDLAHVHEVGIRSLLLTVLRSHTNPAIFWGIDMDVVRAADAPGVSAPNATGISGEELCQVAQIAGADRRTRLFELTEVNPTYDIDDRTCRLAAAAIWHFLCAVRSRP
jgi:formiminoglutamase